MYEITLFNDVLFLFFFQAEDGIRDKLVTGVQTCALPICPTPLRRCAGRRRRYTRRLRPAGRSRPAQGAGASRARRAADRVARLARHDRGGRVAAGADRRGAPAPPRRGRPPPAPPEQEAPGGGSRPPRG